MDLQLELLPYHFYNTLGFEEELIDYIDHVDDSIMLEKIAPLMRDDPIRLILAAALGRLSLHYILRGKGLSDLDKFASIRRGDILSY